MKNKRLGITLTLLSVICLVISGILPLFARGNAEWIEAYYTNGLYQYLVTFLTSISNLFSFSMGEWMIVVLMIVLLFFVIRLLISLLKKKFDLVFTYTLIIVLIISFNVLFFQLAFGVNNYRLPTQVLFGFDIDAITEDDLIEAYAFLVEKTNETYELMGRIEPLTAKEIMSSAYVGYKDLNKFYPFISDNKVVVKPLMISPLFSSSGYTGIYLYFIGEPNINIMPPTYTLPFTASHEIAHQKGFSSEDDASFVGFMACISQSNPRFHYSAYQAMMTYIGNSLYKTNKDAYLQLASMRSEGVIQDIYSSKEFWSQNIDEKNEAIHNQVNDAFLKANNQPDGIINYSKVTELFIAAYKKGLLSQ